MIFLVGEAILLSPTFSLQLDAFSGKAGALEIQINLINCSGIGRAYGHVLAGRAISGIGGAGMTVLVSIIIAGVQPSLDRIYFYADDLQMWCQPGR